MTFWAKPSDTCKIDIIIFGPPKNLWFKNKIGMSTQNSSETSDSLEFIETHAKMHVRAILTYFVAWWCGSNKNSSYKDLWPKCKFLELRWKI